jgi:hypothetical protein
VRAEGDWVTGASGERVHLDSIVEMDRHKWADKGIAYAIYEEGGKRRRLTLSLRIGFGYSLFIYEEGGKRRRLTLDDHKFLGCEAIILEAEKRMAARAAVVAPANGDAPAA